MDGQVNSLNILHFQIQLPLKFIYTNILQLILISLSIHTVRKLSKYGDFTGAYFPVFSPRIQSEYRKYGPKKLYLETSRAVSNKTIFFIVTVSN